MFRSLFVAFSLFSLALATTFSDPLDDPLNKPFAVKWEAQGPYKVFQNGVGLGGFDTLTCDTSIPRTLTLPWTTAANTHVRKAFLVWQAESDWDTPYNPTYNLLLDGASMMTGFNPNTVHLTSGSECNHLTGNHAYSLKRSDVYYVDITDQVKPKLNNKVGPVSFDIEFTSACTKLEKANGVSMIVVGSNCALFPHNNDVQIQIGAVAYDQNTFHMSPASFDFNIAPTGLLEGQRVDDLQLLVGFSVGEAEHIANQDPEGYRVNSGPWVNFVIDGLTGGPKWDANTFIVKDCDMLTGTETTTNTPCFDDSNLLNVEFRSHTDCLIFVALALEYQVHPAGVPELCEDPHMTTWDGIKQTLKAEGDFVMVESQSTGLAVHARFSKNKRGPWAPWTTALAARCSSASGFVEITADGFTHPKLVGEGVKVNTVSDRVLQVVCEETGLAMTAMRLRFHRMNYINVRFEKLANLTADVSGLLGSPNGSPLDDLESRDGLRFTPQANRGHFIGHNLMQLVAIQNSWRVLDSETMFSHPFESSESGPLVNQNARGAENKPLSREEAKEACTKANVFGSTGLLMCIHDAMTTGSALGAMNQAEWKLSTSTCGQVAVSVPMAAGGFQAA